MIFWAEFVIFLPSYADPLDIEEKIGHEVDVIVDAGATGIEPTTVLDLSHGAVEILRAGRGDVSAFR